MRAYASAGLLSPSVGPFHARAARLRLGRFECLEAAFFFSGEAGFDRAKRLASTMTRVPLPELTQIAPGQWHSCFASGEHAFDLHFVTIESVSPLAVGSARGGGSCFSFKLENDGCWSFSPIIDLTE